MDSELTKRYLKMVCLFVLALAAACSEQADGEGMNGDQGGETTSSEISEMWVYNQSRVRVLAEIYERSPESVPAIGSEEDPYYQTRHDEWETNIDYLQDSGILHVSEGNDYVDTELGVIEAGSDIPGGGDMVGQAISDTLRDSEVSWCGGGYAHANEFARDVSDSVYGLHDTESSYIQEIERRVGCAAEE